MKDIANDITLLTGREASTRLGVATKTINRWRKEGLIQALQLPDGTYRYNIAQIIAALGGMKRGRS